MKRWVYGLGIAALLFGPANANAAWVHRLWNGSFHFYTSSDYEATVVGGWPGWRLEAFNFFYTYDSGDPNTTVDIMRCYSAYKGINTYMLGYTNSNVSPCERNGMQTIGSLGRMRLRGLEQYPQPGLGQPIYAMYRVIGRSPDGTNISDTLITNGAYEASLACGNGWIPMQGASYRTCLWGYVAF